MHRPARLWLYSLLSAALLITGAVYFYPLRSYPELKLSAPPREGDAELYSPILGGQSDASKLYYAGEVGAVRSMIPTYNLAGASGPTPRAPLFIAFTRNNAMLQQCVLSYLAAGWPAADMIVVDNSGTLDSNPEGHLTTANPFYLDYGTLQRRYGVSVLQTPTLLSFSQLQNFFLRTSIANSWPFFFWSHMDVLVLGDEDATPYRSFHSRVLDVLRETEANSKDYATRWFAYDYLTLVNVEAWKRIGQWDVFIPYYTADCDAYSRMVMSGYDRAAADAKAGMIFDVAETLSDPESWFLPAASERGTLRSERYKKLLEELRRLEDNKKKDSRGRNTWQSLIEGGKGEGWTYDPTGFGRGWWETAEMGKRVFKEKWGQEDCNLDSHGATLDDAWKNA